MTSLDGRIQGAGDRQAGPLQVMYGVDGRAARPEQELAALARAGRLDEAQFAFEKMLTHANHVGLYVEEIGPTGEQLGNFPQAFKQLAPISAAYNLDRALG
jgi:hypothetical protein